MSTVKERRSPLRSKVSSVGAIDTSFHPSMSSPIFTREIVPSESRTSAAAATLPAIAVPSTSTPLRFPAVSASVGRRGAIGRENGMCHDGRICRTGHGRGIGLIGNRCGELGSLRQRRAGGHRQLQHGGQNQGDRGHRGYQLRTTMAGLSGREPKLQSGHPSSRGVQFERPGRPRPKRIQQRHKGPHFRAGSSSCKVDSL